MRRTPSLHSVFLHTVTVAQLAAVCGLVNMRWLVRDAAMDPKSRSATWHVRQA